MLHKKSQKHLYTIDEGYNDIAAPMDEGDYEKLANCSYIRLSPLQQQFEENLDISFLQHCGFNEEKNKKSADELKNSVKDFIKRVEDEKSKEKNP